MVWFLLVRLLNCNLHIVKQANIAYIIIFNRFSSDVSIFYRFLSDLGPKHTDFFVNLTPVELRPNRFEGLILLTYTLDFRGLLWCKNIYKILRKPLQPDNYSFYCYIIKLSVILKTLIIMKSFSYFTVKFKVNYTVSRLLPKPNDWWNDLACFVISLCAMIVLQSHYTIKCG